MKFIGDCFGLFIGRDYSTFQDWSVFLGWGKPTVGQEGRRCYRHAVQIILRHPSAWFWWYIDFLTIERGNAIYQRRICGWKDWPLAVWAY